MASVKRVVLSVAVLGLALSCSMLGFAFAASSSHSAAASASRQVQINAYYTDGAVEPSWFTPTPSYWCANYVKIHYLDEIHWSSWGGPEATGSAIAGRGCAKYNGDGTETPIGPREGSPVTITLGGVKQCAGFTIYTTYSLALSPGAGEPAIWRHVKSGQFPCNVAAPGCTGDLIPDHFMAKGPDDCALGLSDLVGKRLVRTRWIPKTPPGQITQLRRLMASQWTNWNQLKTIGVGAMLDQHKIARGAETDLLWPGKVELSDPIWCPRLGSQGLQGDYGNPLAYTSLRLTLYGTGVKEKRRQPQSYYSRLMIQVRKMVGKPGLGEQVFTQHATASTATCGY